MYHDGMSTRKEPHDFRSMSLEEIRAGISKLNRDIKALRQAEEQVDVRFFAGQGIAISLTFVSSIVFPPAALISTAFGVVDGMSKMPVMAIMTAKRKECVELRRQFKEVYRARPGRKYFNPDARKKKFKA